MEKNQMKNIVVLKNLPSNLVEEAIVILKNNKTAKKLEYIEKKEVAKSNVKNPKDYIIREAESVISSYINATEKKEEKQDNIKINERYKKLKIYSVMITIAFILLLIRL